MHRIFEWFLCILADKQGKLFPVNEVHITDRTITRAELAADFQMRLTFFWSNDTVFHKDQMYRIGFTPHGFPKSDPNTNTLLLPLDVNSKKELYSKLVVATFNISGKELYGGGAYFL